MSDVESVKLFLNGVPYYGMVAVAAVASLFPGIPEEAFLLIIGYLVGTGSIEFWKTCIFLIIGFLVMDSVLFALSRRGTKILQTLQTRVLGVSPDEHRDFIKKHVIKIIFFSRFVLFLRWIGPVLSGSVKTSWQRFLMVDIVALCVYVPLMLLLGIYYRSRIDKVVEGINTVGNIVGMVLLLAVLVYTVIWVKKQFKKKLVQVARGEVETYKFLGFRFKKKKIDTTCN